MDENASWPHDAILHAWWVEPGRLLAGEYPGARTASKAAEKVRLLIDAGVDSIVDLTTPDDHLSSYEEALRDAAEKAGREVHHFAYPIPDMGVIEREATTRSSLTSEAKWTQAESFTSTAGAERAGRPPSSAASSSTTGWTTSPRSIA
jgi:hypothetical protein